MQANLKGAHRNLECQYLEAGWRQKSVLPFSNGIKRFGGGATAENSDRVLTMIWAAGQDSVSKLNSNVEASGKGLGVNAPVRVGIRVIQALETAGDSTPIANKRGIK